jgi:hypothetical protein
MQESVDVVMSFDSTGSMYPCLTQVRKNLAETVKNLFKNVPNIRIGIIAHGDYCDGPRAITVLDLTNDKDKIIEFVKEVKATDGGDAPECYELALHTARSMSWTSGKSKVLVLIGDDVPHGPSYPQNTKRLDWRNELGLLMEANINVYAVQALGRSHATKFYEEVAKKTGGFHLELNQFQHIVDLIKAVCFKQEGNAVLQQYEEELNKTGKMNRGVDTIIGVLLGRKSSKKYASAVSLEAVPPGRFQVLEVDRDVDIQTFANDNGLGFKKGRGFYEFTKSVTVQDYKEVILMDNNTGDMFSGDKAREMAGIPSGVTASVRPGSGKLAGYSCFIQSTSCNRKLLKGTKFLYEVEDWKD